MYRRTKIAFSVQKTAFFALNILLCSQVYQNGMYTLVEMHVPAFRREALFVHAIIVLIFVFERKEVSPRKLLYIPSYLATVLL